MRLKSCLSLQSYYRDAVRSLRDALGASYNLSHFTSVSSLTPGTAGSAAGRLVIKFIVFDQHLEANFTRFNIACCKGD